VIRSPAVWIPAVMLAAATALFWWTDLDTALVQPFYSGEASSESLEVRWPLKEAQPWKAIYDWGVVPAWILACGGMAVWIVSFFWKKLENWRDPGLFFAVLLVVGPGILVNVLFKPYFSRPRPHATRSLGGDREFVPVWHRGQGEDDSSFPSGHAAVGFYLMAPAFVFYRRRPWLAAGFLMLGLTCGTVIGLARMVAGCHFPSDVLWAGGIVYYTALLLAAPFRFGKDSAVFSETRNESSRPFRECLDEHGE
jgi:membrane-associated PAP2 superfamily phosphatase